MGGGRLCPGERSAERRSPSANCRARFKAGSLVSRDVAGHCTAERKGSSAVALFGQLAAIGRRTGVANILGLTFSGFFAWWLWRSVSLSKLSRLEKKLRVALDWTLDLSFAKDFARAELPPRESNHSV